MPHLLLVCVLSFSKALVNSKCNGSTYTHITDRRDMKTSMSYHKCHRINSIFISKEVELNGCYSTDNLDSETSK